MTFRNEDVRRAFHQLPTARQVEFAETEERVARYGQRLHCEDVLTYGNVLEVLIRIAFDTQTDAGTCDSSGAF